MVIWLLEVKEEIWDSNYSSNKLSANSFEV